MTTVNPKTRGNYPVELCTRSLPKVGRGVCVNFGKKCGECFKFSEFEEGPVHVDTGDNPDAA